MNCLRTGLLLSANTRNDARGSVYRIYSQTRRLSRPPVVPPNLVAMDSHPNTHRRWHMDKQVLAET